MFLLYSNFAQKIHPYLMLFSDQLVLADYLLDHPLVYWNVFT